MTDTRSSPGSDSPRTNWNDIGSICRTFGNEREAVTAIFSGRMTPGRNFWKEAADEIERLRGLAQAAPDPTSRAAIIERITNITTWLREPDWTETASLEWLKDWMDRRPIDELAMVAMLMPAAVPPSPVAGEWQPIETAPRDGTPIEACNTRHPSHAPVVVRWNAAGFSDVLPDPYWCDAATADGSALYFNENFFDFWKLTTALPASSVSSTHSDIQPHIYSPDYQAMGGGLSSLRPRTGQAVALDASVRCACRQGGTVSTAR